jgi:hypothetical protein
METTMKKMAFLVPLICMIFALGLAGMARAQGGSVSYVPYDDGAAPPDQGDQYLLTPEELDNLVAPIALYPDPLIAQILPAATFFDEIDQAARYVRQYGSAARIDDMPWDVSVKAIAHYPDVLNMLDQKQDWTVALGQAYIDQPQEVMDAIQRLRAAAEAEGNLYSTPQQQVVVGADDISIVPASPEYIYVPVYDPQVVYVEPYDPSYTIITFSTGFFIGAWLNRDCDWHRHRVYYHGWRGGGWVGRARPHVHDRRGVYINRNAAVIHTNDRILTRDNRAFRQQLRTDTTRRVEQGRLPGATVPGRTRTGRPDHQRTPGAARPQSGRTRVPATGAATSPAAPVRSPAAGSTTTAPTRQRPARATTPAPATGTAPTTTRSPAGRPAPAPSAPAPSAPAPAAPAPATGTAPAPAPHVPGIAPQAATGGQRQPRSTNRDVYRGRDVQKTQPASQSGYGGYGSSRDATIYRQRGQSSRENMRSVPPRSTTTPRSTPTPPVPRSVVAPTPAAPRTVAPAAAPRSFAPAPAPAPRSFAPAPAPRSAPAPAPVRSAPMSVPSAPRPAAPSAPVGGMHR